MKLVPCFFSKQGSTAKGSWLGSLPRYHFHNGNDKIATH